MNSTSTDNTCNISIALALVAMLGFTATQADSSKTIDQNTLTDWGQKTKLVLSRKIDQKLDQQLMLPQIPIPFVKAITNGYRTANLVTTGQPLAHSNLAPLSGIPVVIIVNPQDECLHNL